MDNPMNKQTLPVFWSANRFEVGNYAADAAFKHLALLGQEPATPKPVLRQAMLEKKEAARVYRLTLVLAGCRDLTLTKDPVQLAQVEALRERGWIGKLAPGVCTKEQAPYLRHDVAVKAWVKGGKRILVAPSVQVVPLGVSPEPKALSLGEDARLSGLSCEAWTALVDQAAKPGAWRGGDGLTYVQRELLWGLVPGQRAELRERLRAHKASLLEAVGPKPDSNKERVLWRETKALALVEYKADSKAVCQVWRMLDASEDKLAKAQLPTQGAVVARVARKQQAAYQESKKAKGNVAMQNTRAYAKKKFGEGTPGYEAAIAKAMEKASRRAAK